MAERKILVGIDADETECGECVWNGEFSYTYCELFDIDLERPKKRCAACVAAERAAGGREV
jgi:hypothetical protein